MICNFSQVMSIDRLVKDAQVVAVVCNQWGDTGKGKFSDYLGANWADVIIRGTGGANAGHTVKVGDLWRVFHLLPSGIMEDANGKTNILGQGMEIHLETLLEEMDEVARNGGTFDNFYISDKAQIVFNHHIEYDKQRHMSMANGGIGSTGRGIGPAYEDRTGRRGVEMGLLCDPVALRERLEKQAKKYDFDVSEVMRKIEPFAQRLVPYIRDTFTLVHEKKEAGKKILLEGAQGLLLSVNDGSYPYVTSSDPSLDGTAKGAGLSAKDVDLCLGIVKFPFMTRVGGGPFPTEIGGHASEAYCASEPTLLQELEAFGIPYKGKKYNSHDPRITELINSPHPFFRGVGLRLLSVEYGATTGRARRVGWIDAVAGRYARRINGPDVILTKVDIGSHLGEIQLCDGYEIDGHITQNFKSNPRFLYGVEPHFATFDGYGDVRGIDEYKGLPSQLHRIIAEYERLTGSNVAALSVGPDRDETIIR